MNRKSAMKTDELLEAFDQDSALEEVFDFQNPRMPNLEVKRVNVDFPQWMVDELDEEAARIGVPRQSLIKLWIAERLDGLKA